MYRRPVRRGFTVIELSYVLAVIGLLVAITVPAYDGLVKRARADEARTVLAAIADAELRYFREYKTYIACSADQPIPTGPGALFPNQTPCWQRLGIELWGEVHYRYRVDLEGGTFFVIAEGDLDADGETSKFLWNGRLHQLEVERELE